MSGIVAIVNFDGAPVDPETLHRMAEQCAYRGPDGIRYWIHGNAGMAHLALHATPESLREIQPQLSADGRFCLTADVRVDNRPELIPLLNTKGEPMDTNSTDADLLLAAYRVWGDACPKQIIGDYAFAIWDKERQYLFCARDVFGVKSLHYSRVGTTLCVASEAQQIIQHPIIPRTLDEAAVADFLTGNYNDEGRTMFQDVWAVKRAHFLTAGPSEQRVDRYWDIDPKNKISYKNDEEYVSQFLEIFHRSISDRMRTQGETVGITMSGGMDSTSIAAVAQRISKQQENQPHLMACSYAFKQLKGCDESQYSRPMADELGIDLSYVPAENFWYLDNDETFTPSLETPFMAGESLTRNILSIFKERGARVWFTGHGGDSLLASSPLIYADRLGHGEFSALLEIGRYWKGIDLPFSNLIQAYWQWCLKPLVPEFIKQIIRKTRKLETPHWFNADFARRTHIAERLADPQVPNQFSERARQANYISAVQIDPIQMTINWAERLGSHFHQEARHPFLDRRLCEFMLSIPPEQNFKIDLMKFILRKAMRGILPEIVNSRRDKTEFSNYTGLGLRHKEIERVRCLLKNPGHGLSNIVDITKINSIYENYVSEGNGLLVNKIWRFILLELWLNKYW